jgi:hypothetical protein
MVARVSLDGSLGRPDQQSTDEALLAVLLLGSIGGFQAGPASGAVARGGGLAVEPGELLGTARGIRDVYRDRLGNGDANLSRASTNLTRGRTA